MGRPRTPEQWTEVLDLIERFMNLLRAGNLGRLKQALDQAEQPEPGDGK